MMIRTGIFCRILALFAFFSIGLSTAPPLFAQDEAPAAAAEAEGKPTTTSSGSSFFDILNGGGLIGWALWIVLFGTSLAGFALVGDSFVTVREDKIIPQDLVDRVSEAMEQGDLIKAQNITSEEPGPMANILNAGFENVENGFDAVQDSVSVAADLEAERIMQRVNYLNVVGNIAPMLGLLGTVQGMIFAFKNLAGGGAGQQKLLALNISMALWTTAVGLMVAIPCLAFFYFFRNRATSMILKMELIALDQIKVLRHVEVVDDED